MTDYCYILIAHLSLSEFVSAMAGFLGLFSDRKNLSSLNSEYDSITSLARFKVVSSLPLDEDSFQTFERGLRHTIAKEKIFSFYNDTKISNPVHLTLGIIKVDRLPSLFMEKLHRIFTLQRFGLTSCSHLIQIFPGDYVLVCFHSLEDSNARVQQLIRDSLNINRLISLIEI